jgi:hypothetical protein
MPAHACRHQEKAEHSSGVCTAAHLLGDGLAAAAAAVEPDPVLPAVEGRGEAGGRADDTPGCVTPALPLAGNNTSADCAALHAKETGTKSTQQAPRA